MSEYLDRPTRRVNFKSDANLYADIYSNVTWDDSKAFRDAKENDEGLFRMIKEWNVPGPDGNTLPLTYENLGKLRTEDINLLFTNFWDIIGLVADKVVDAEKKKETNKAKSTSSKPLTNSPAEDSPTTP